MPGGEAGQESEKLDDEIEIALTPILIDMLKSSSLKYSISVSSPFEFVQFGPLEAMVVEPLV